MWDQETRDGSVHDEFLDFDAAAAYGVYNWELFYHVPLYIARLLSQNQQFEKALAWFHYVFDPTKAPDPNDPNQGSQRFWIPKPLYALNQSDVIAQRINNLLRDLDDPSATDHLAAEKEYKRWRKNPLNPFPLADMRPVAYMKAAVMSYLDNLIAWADYLFASGSREALSEATLLYVLASEILGPQPTAVTPPKADDRSYSDLALGLLDDLSNEMVVENVMGPAAGDGGVGGEAPGATAPSISRSRQTRGCFGTGPRSLRSSTCYGIARTHRAKFNSSRCSTRRSTRGCCRRRRRPERILRQS